MRVAALGVVTAIAVVTWIAANFLDLRLTAWFAAASAAALGGLTFYAVGRR